MRSVMNTQRVRIRSLDFKNVPFSGILHYGTVIDQGKLPMLRILNKRNFTLILGFIVVIIILISSRMMALPVANPTEGLEKPQIRLHDISLKEKIKYIVSHLNQIKP